MLTKEQELSREGRIGSSDVAAILGKSPFTTAYDVWRRLVFGVYGAETPRMRRGSELEPAIVRIASAELGIGVRSYPAPTVVGDGARLPAWFVDHADAGLDDGSLLEVKAYAYADAGLPEAVRQQCHWHLLAHPDAPRCHVARFVNVGNVLYDAVERDDAELSATLAAVAEWHERYVATETPPPLTTAEAVGATAYNVISKGDAAYVADAAEMRGEDGRSIEAVTAEYAALTLRIEEMQTHADSLKNIVANAMWRDKALAVSATLGKWSIVDSRRTDWKGLAESLGPDAQQVAAFTKPSSALRFTSRR